MKVQLGLRYRMILSSLMIAVMTAAMPVSADPITKREAADWVQLVRRLNGWGPEVSVSQDAETRLLQANIGLMRNPDSREFFRDRGDAYHTLGHMAEHRHRFEEAIDLHREAIESYRRSGYDTRESWSDGRDHAREHIFMNLYDLGVYFDRQDQKSVADRYFRVSLVYAAQNDLYRRLGGTDGDRFGPRYLALRDRVDQATVFALKLGVENGAELQKVMGELRCSAIFLPMYSR